MTYVYIIKYIIAVKEREWHTYTWLSSPSMSSMKKKQMDQNGAAGILATAAGYAMNAKPGPTCTVYIREKQHNTDEMPKHLP